MKEFLLVFRSEHNANAKQPTQAEMQASMKQWEDWMGSLGAQNKLVNPGNPLEPAGMVVKTNGTIVNGPYVETKEAVGGYTIIRAASLEEATALCKGCPIFNGGGNVEVRPIMPIM